MNTSIKKSFSLLTILLALSTNHIIANPYFVPEFLSDSVVSSFQEEHEEAVQVLWKPYPLSYAPTNKKGPDHVRKMENPLFVEATFVENGTTNTKIYNNSGNCLVWKKSLELSQIDKIFLEQIAEYNINTNEFDITIWRPESFEIILKNDMPSALSNNCSYKLVIFNGLNMRTFLFDENKTLLKELKLDQKIHYHGKNKNLFIESIYNGYRNSISEEEIPEQIKNRMKQEGMKVFASAKKQEAVDLVLQKNVVSASGISVHPSFEVVSKKKGKLQKIVYSIEDMEVEIKDMLLINELPKFVRYKLSDKSYNNWQFEEYVEVYSPHKGSYIYTIFAIENGIPRILIIHEN